MELHKANREHVRIGGENLNQSAGESTQSSHLNVADSSSQSAPNNNDLVTTTSQGSNSGHVGSGANASSSAAANPLSPASMGRWLYPWINVYYHHVPRACLALTTTLRTLLLEGQWDAVCYLLGMNPLFFFTRLIYVLCFCFVRFCFLNLLYYVFFCLFVFIRFFSVIPFFFPFFL
jgi:hypothetical protein